MKSTTIAQDELEQFLQVSRDVFRRASVASARGRSLLATPPTGKYPYVYTRDLAVTIAALCELDSLDVARDFCRFLLRAQSPDGSWVQRYDVEGPTRSGGAPGGRDGTRDVGAADLRQERRATTRWSRLHASRSSGRPPTPSSARSTRISTSSRRLARFTSPTSAAAMRFGTIARTRQRSRSATGYTVASAIDGWP